jgi:hypothetical protein
MNFVKGIRKVIAQEAADPTQPIHTQVPASNWLYLDNAINSAYPNMCRERVNLLEPNNMAPKIRRAASRRTSSNVANRPSTTTVWILTALCSVWQTQT